MQHATDWEERTTADLLTIARRSGYFANVIDDAKWLQAEHGYCWIVALKIAVDYWR